MLGFVKRPLLAWCQASLFILQKVKYHWANHNNEESEHDAHRPREEDVEVGKNRPYQAKDDSENVDFSGGLHGRGS